MSGNVAAQMIAQGGMTTLVGWLFYYILTVQIPKLIQLFREEMAEKRREFQASLDKQQAFFREELHAERRECSEAIKTVAAAVEKQSIVVARNSTAIDELSETLRQVLPSRAIE